MFGNLKKKLSVAIQQGLVITESLQQRLSPASTPGTPKFEDSIGSSRSSLRSASSGGDLADINLTVGCNLLAKYEEDWKAIHEANEENAQQAEKLAKQIDILEQCTSAQRVNMTDLISCLSGVPELVAKLKQSQETLQELTALCEAAEEKLERLQDVSEECELQEFMLHKHFELSQYKQKKMANLESYRQKVASQHQQKIRQHEERYREIQRERQAVFDDAFRGDIQEFKQTGTLPKLQKEVSREIALEEVDLENSDTKDALEQFLNG